MNSKKVTEFADIITNTDLLAYLASVFISVPTPIQVDCIPKLMGPGHFTVQSHTGTGKTLGYLLPLVSQLKASESKDDVRINGSPRAVIVAPTRELAGQIFSVVKDISHHAKLRVRKLVGGDKGKSLKSMFSMPMDILVTTPDRCLRSLKNRELSKASLKYLILDEADHLLEPSFKSIMQQMASELQDTDFQLFLVSATRPAQFTETIQSFFPALTLQAIDATQGNTAEMRIDIFNLAVEEKEKFIYVKDFLRQQKHRNGVIFTGSKLRAQRLAEELLAAGQKNMFLLHKDLEIKDRAEVIANFRKKGGVLIATDIFARGIDIPHLQWVLNFDLPSEPYYYLHRNGRVGRLDREGDVYNFITSKDAERIERINKALVTQGRTDLKIDATARKKISFKRK
ncbi:MAG: DEAD/DEAH box helicase [Candidatus Sericytochromatia bacterium]